MHAITSPGSLTLGNNALGDYTLVGASGSVTITALAVDLTGTRTYDGTPGVSYTILTVANAALGDNVDVASGSGTLASKNAGSQSITSFGNIALGNNSAGDYTLSGAIGSVTITQEALTITAVANSKTYDSTTSAAALPTITGGTVMTGDTGNFTDTYGTKNVGTGLTLTPGGLVSDGNSGNNYSYNYIPVSTGTIIAEALTITAVTSSKTYDGSIAAPTLPTITSGAIQGSNDTANFTETFSTKNVGTGLTLTPGGTVNDGFSGNDYTYHFVTVSTGSISQRALTITAVTNTKPYDGTTSAAATPTITVGSVATGDHANFIETYNSVGQGTGLTLTPSGTVSDGNSGQNYSYNFVAVSTGVITPATGATASFIGTDTSTQGNWINVYGSQGYND